MSQLPTQSFRDLIMWQKAHQFVLGIYELVKDFPKTETYGLTSQLTRAAVSVPANIAEGYRKRSTIVTWKLPIVRLKSAGII